MFLRAASMTFSKKLKDFHIVRLFKDHLIKTDAKMYECITQELKKQQQTVNLIASENIVSTAVLDAQGSILTNKYAEGYPGRRYYGGCEYVDQAEMLAVTRAQQLFDVKFVNIEPHSGSQANQAVFLALLKPGDKILALELSCGGHLTHGSRVNQSGKWFDAVHYGVHKDSAVIDYDEVRKLAQEHKPKLIIAGCSAYPRKLDFGKFRKIADEVGAHLMVDMAHFAGLVAAQIYENPAVHAHVVTSTTHKTLRGPRGGLIMTNDEEIAKLVNRAVFPGLQGGPLMHVIAAKGVAFLEAQSDYFKSYMRGVVANAQHFASVLQKRGYDILTGGTDCHLFLVDLRKQKLELG